MQRSPGGGWLVQLAAILVTLPAGTARAQQPAQAPDLPTQIARAVGAYRAPARPAIDRAALI